MKIIIEMINVKNKMPIERNNEIMSNNVIIIIIMYENSYRNI